MDLNTARKQLEEVDARRAQADAEALGEPKGFRIPFLISLWVALASRDLPNPASVIVLAIAAVSCVVLLTWMAASRKTRLLASRYARATAGPTIAFLTAAIVFIVAVQIPLTVFDVPLRGVISATVYVAFCFYGMTKADAATRRNLAAQP